MVTPEVFVSVDRRADEVAVIRLDRPKANALSHEVLVQLRDAAIALGADPPGAVVVWGGERIFAAGADIAQLGGGGPETVVNDFREALDALGAIPRAVIAAITGFALGGGLELALACDLRICATNAKLGLPEVLLGVIPGGGGTQRLSRLIGPGRAKELVFTGRQVGAAEALAMGLVNEVVPAADLFAVALERAASLAAGARLAQAAAKRAIDCGLEGTLEEGFEFEREGFLRVVASEDAQRGITSFLSTGPGKATFVGR